MNRRRHGGVGATLFGQIRFGQNRQGASAALSRRPNRAPREDRSKPLARSARSHVGTVTCTDT
jgi:hypothetical protein